MPLPAEPRRGPRSSDLLVRTLEGHSGGVLAVALSADGHVAVSGSYDNTLKVWDLQTGELLRTLSGHLDWVSAVAQSADGDMVISGSHDQTLKVWDLQTGDALLTLEGHRGTVKAVAVAADGRTIVSGSQDRTLKVWDVHTGRMLRTLEGHSGGVLAVALSADGRVAISARGQDAEGVGPSDRPVATHPRGPPGLCRRCRHRARRPRRRLRFGGQDAEGGTFRPAGCCRPSRATAARSGPWPSCRMTTPPSPAAWDNTMILWDLNTGEVLHALKGGGSIEAVALSGDGRIAVSGSNDGILRVWSDLRGVWSGEAPPTASTEINSVGPVATRRSTSAGIDSRFSPARRRQWSYGRRTISERHVRRSGRGGFGRCPSKPHGWRLRDQGLAKPARRGGFGRNAFHIFRPLRRRSDPPVLLRPWVSRG